MSADTATMQAIEGSQNETAHLSPPAPAFNVEPPTPTGPTLRDQQQQRFVDPKEAIAIVPEMHSEGLFAPAQDRGHSPSDFSSNGSFRASPIAYSRHHPYAHSPSSYDDLSESYDGGPVRTRRTHSHSSYASMDGDYTPEDDPPYEEPDEMYVEQQQHQQQAVMPRVSSKRSNMPKEPVRLTATGKPSHARRLPAGHIKRPRNAFILFRSHACVNNLVPASLGITDHRHISRIVGQMWKNLPAEERKVWEDQAEKEKEEHRRAHPDYKYRPVYRREGVVRRRRKRAVDDKDVEEEERKCEVVARVLLEGGDISEDRVEREIEIQRERDEVEGRVRGPAAKPPSRSASRRAVQIQQPQFDMNYGMVQYGQVFNPFDMSRRGDAPRSMSINSPYSNDGQGEQAEEEHDAYGAPHQRSHTMPPSLDFNQGYYHHAEVPPFSEQDLRNGRAPPPRPLSLYRTGDASLVPPASPGILFGAGADMQFPTTPRTLAMQQHSWALQQRLRGSNGTLLSPRAADFGLNSSRNGTRPDGTTETMLVSPSRPFHQDPASLGFEHGFLDNALAGERGGQAAGATEHEQGNERRESLEMEQHQRSYSADAASEHLKWQQQHQQTDQHGNAEKTEGGQQSYSALGELAAVSTATQGHQSKQSISFQPDADVTYVFLDAKQAQDQALIDSLRAQGFGITLDASQEEIAALSATTLAAR